MTTDRAKVLDKIRKCFALGKSPNEHEAAAALRQAQKLMAMHNLTEEDVGLMEFACETIVTDYEWGKKKPLIVVSVVQVIMHAMGVTCTMGAARNERGKVMHTVRYYGPRDRVHLATYAHQVVYRACGVAWRKYQATVWKTRVGDRASFYHGWCSAVMGKVEALTMTDEEKRAVEKMKGETSTAKLGTKTVNGDVMGAGAAAARDFQLNRPVGTERNRLEKL